MHAKTTLFLAFVTLSELSAGLVIPVRRDPDWKSGKATAVATTCGAVLGAAALGCSWGGQTTAAHALWVGSGVAGAYGAAAGIATNFGKKKTADASTETADIENQRHELNEMSHAQSTVNKDKPLPATPKENGAHQGSSEAESSKQAQQKAESAKAKEEPKKEEPKKEESKKEEPKKEQPKEPEGKGKGKEKAH